MSFGTFYALPRSVEALFQRAATKSEWYEAMQSAGVAEAPSLSAEESLPAWEYSLQQSKHSSTLGKLFVGDANSRLDTSGGPDVVFHRVTSVRAIAAAMAEIGEPGMQSLLAACGHKADGWLYGPLREFIELAASKEQSVIVLWGG